MNMKMILAVMDTVQAVVKIRPEEMFRPVRGFEPMTSVIPVQCCTN